MRSSLPSKTAIKALSRELSDLDPREPGPYRVIAEMRDPEYLRKRAIELLHEAGMGATISKIKDAIRFLLLALYYYQIEKLPKTKEPFKRPTNPDTRE